MSLVGKYFINEEEKFSGKIIEVADFNANATYYLVELLTVANSWGVDKLQRIVKMELLEKCVLFDLESDWHTWTVERRDFVMPESWHSGS
jgi:hypothetical protein